MTPPTPGEGRGEGHSLAMDLLRPSSSSGSHGRVGDARPVTSASSLDVADRQRTTAGGLRDRISALAYRRTSPGHRDAGPVAETEPEGLSEGGGARDAKGRGKMLPWAQGRNRVG